MSQHSRSVRAWARATQAVAAAVALVGVAQAVLLARSLGTVRTRTELDATLVSTGASIWLTVACAGVLCYQAGFWWGRLHEHTDVPNVARRTTCPVCSERTDATVDLVHPALWPAWPLVAAVPFVAAAIWGLDDLDRISDWRANGSRVGLGLLAAALAAGLVALSATLGVAAVHRLTRLHEVHAAAAVDGERAHDPAIARPRYVSPNAVGWATCVAFGVAASLASIGVALAVVLLILIRDAVSYDDVAGFVGFAWVACGFLVVAWVFRAVWKHRVSTNSTKAWGERREFRVAAMVTSPASADADPLLPTLERWAVVSKVASIPLAVVAMTLFGEFPSGRSMPIRPGDVDRIGLGLGLMALAFVVLAVGCVMSAVVVRRVTVAQERRAAAGGRQSGSSPVAAFVVP